MSMFIQHLHEQIADGFQTYDGALVQGTIPIPEQMLNNFLSQVDALHTRNFDLKYLHLHDDNTLIVSCTVGMILFKKDCTIRLKLDEQIDVCGSPTVRIKIEQIQGVPFATQLVDLLKGTLNSKQNLAQIDGMDVSIFLLSQLQQSLGGQIACSLFASLRIIVQEGKATIQFSLKAPGTIMPEMA